MSFELTDWNLNPNQLWFIKITDSGSLIEVGLYTTQVDASSGTNAQVLGEVSYGTDVSVVLENTEDSTIAISFFTSDETYHLKVSGQNGDDDIILQVSPFVDLPDITNSIYRSEELISKRVTNEINIHTHSAKRRDIGIASHEPELQVSDVCRIYSSFRGIDVLTVLEELIIVGTQNALINQIGTVEYTDLKYE